MMGNDLDIRMPLRNIVCLLFKVMLLF
uniref:Uncharacterized protein n=1 Tax=Arundo donax TaxID=35708 RepID=A0A0A8YEC6_ARUDO